MPDLLRVDNRLLKTPAVCLFVGFCAFYFAFQNFGYMDSSDGDARFALLQAIADHSSFQVQTSPGRKPAPTRFSSGSVLAALPFYCVAKWACASQSPLRARLTLRRATLFSTAAYTALWVCLVYLLVLEFSPSARTAYWIAILTGIGSLIFPYSKSFQCENFAGLTITATLLGAIRFGRTLRWQYASATGLMLGAAFTVKPELAFIVPLLLAYFAWVTRGIGARAWPLALAAAIGAIPGIAWILFYNFVRYGHFLNTGYEHFPFNHPLLSGIFVQVLSPGKGILWFVPLLWVSLYYTPTFLCRQKHNAALVLATGLMMLSVYACYYMPDGDTALGARYMVSYMPLFLLPLVVWFDQRKTSWSGRVTFIAISTVSILLQMMNALVSFYDYFFDKVLLSPIKVREGVRFLTHYFPDASPLRGNYHNLCAGLLDCRFVSCMPSEHRLTILPAFWFALSIALCLFAIGWLFVARGASMGARLNVFWLPLLTLICGVVHFPDYGNSGLRLVYASGGETLAETTAIDVDIPEEVHDKRLMSALNHLTASLTWSGSIRVKRPGNYLFAVDSESTAVLKIDNRQIIARTTDSKGDTTASAELSPGWHQLSFTHGHYAYLGRVKLRWQPPGEPLQPLGSEELRHP
jgi:hypothetical protein